MPSGRPLVPLSLTAQQRRQLQSWALRPKTAQALAMRSRIVLLAADGLSNTEIARRQGCSLPTAGKWRQRFIDQGPGWTVGRAASRHSATDQRCGCGAGAGAHAAIPLSRFIWL